jgi:hypothetical protein
MKIFKTAAMGAVGAIVFLGLSFSNGGASASPAINPGSAFSSHQSELIQTVDYHRRGVRPRYDDRHYFDDRRYDRRYHGDRYRSPRGAYRHRYTDGYYYANPWWALGLGAVIAVEPVRPGRVRPIAPARSQAHVAWCFDRYRSYNQNSDTFTGYDGVVRSCRSPYR